MSRRAPPPSSTIGDPPRAHVVGALPLVIVLGLHGWDDTHDAAAALVVDGATAAFVEEERLSRRKHALSGRPHLAAHAVLHEAGVAIEDVDVVAYGWDLPTYYAHHGADGWAVGDDEFLRAVLGMRPKRMPRLEWVRHHDAHAASAFFGSGFDEATVLVVDGQGEDRSISLYAADQAGIRLLRDWMPSRSLGLLYEAATLHCGFGFLDAGKTMGLAAYGARPEVPLPIMWDDDDMRSPLPDGIEEGAVSAAWSSILAERFGEPASSPRTFDLTTSTVRWVDDGVAAHQPDVAAAAQEAVERCLASLIQYGRQTTGYDRVALAGGVALNCVANGAVLPQCEELFVPPTAHDAGVALGAALSIAAQAGDQVAPFAGADLGLRYSSSAVEATLGAAKVNARRVDDPAAEAADRLLRGEVVGWFQGRMEVGPRALGQRSILALPAPAAVKDDVNRIKGREWWRPLAPSALREESKLLFGLDVSAPYMLLSLELTSEARERMPAIAHVDGSTRVQTVSPGCAPLYRSLLEGIARETGAGVMLNTSFNAPGEPIVCSPADAIRTYCTMGLDALILEDFVLAKA